VRAVVVYPGLDRPPELTDVPAPELFPGGVAVRVVDVGVCGTDREILAGGHGAAPPGRDRLVLGHESLGQVEEVRGPARGPASREAAEASLRAAREHGEQWHTVRAPAFRPGDYVVATVRRGCASCRHCASGMSDFCDTGGFVERGILGMDGFLAERYVEDPAYLIGVPAELARVGVLLEPLSVVEKALQQAFAAQIRVPGRPVATRDPWTAGPSSWQARRALVLGAGPIGMLTAIVLRLLGVEDVAIVERRPRAGKRAMAEAVGARYVATEGGPLRELLPGERYDLVIEAAGTASIVVDALPLLAPNGVVCLTGIFAAGQTPETLALNDLFREMVYRNQAIVTSVNSNRSYFERGVPTMGQIEARWPGLLGRLITRRMPMEQYAEAVEPERDGVKTVVEVAG
jgi:threonine dehydrogenase-like Zn-dependent dehydrogenase